MKTLMKSAVSCALGLLLTSISSASEVLLQIGTATTGANNQLSSSKTYIYNFGVTSAGNGLTLNQLILGVGRNTNISEAITFDIYRGFGGNVGSNSLVSSTSFAATTFNGTSITSYTLNLPALVLEQGAYSIRVSSATPSNASYAFRDGLLGMGGSGLVSESQWIQDSNTGGTAGSTIAPAAGYVLADHQVSASSVTLGRFHANGSGPSSSTLTLSNVAPATSGNVTESLTASLGTLGGSAQAFGLGGEAVLQGGSTVMGVNLARGTGAISGTVELNFNSVQDGSSSQRSGGALAVGSRTISLSAFGYTGKSEWTADADGSWNLNDFANWSAAGGTPGLDGNASAADTALFGSAATADRTISLNGSNAAFGELVFDNASAAYTLATGTGGSLALGSINFQNNTLNNGILQNLAGSHVLDVNISMRANLEYTGAAGSTTTIRGALSSPGLSVHSLSKNGGGLLLLDAANTYTGQTLVNEGTLAIGSSGSIANSSGIRIGNGARLDVSGREGFTVGANQTLSGGGNVSGHVSISGIHSPGFSPGLQIFEDGLSYDTGATFVWELIGNTLEGRGTNFDAVDVTGGTLSIAAGVTSSLIFNFEGSTVDWTDSFWGEDRSWLVFSTESAGQLSLASGSIFDILTVSADSGGSFLNQVSGRSGAFFSWLEQDGDLYLQYTAIPEPTSLALAMLLLLATVLGLRSGKN